MSGEIIRVRRVLEYEGPRGKVEEVIAKSIDHPKSVAPSYGNMKKFIGLTIVEVSCEEVDRTLNKTQVVRGADTLLSEDGQNVIAEMRKLYDESRPIIVRKTP